MRQRTSLGVGCLFIFIFDFDIANSKFISIEGQFFFISCLFTFRPALLLCRFIKLLSSPSNSLASINFLANLVPKSISTLQPPHFQPSGAGSLDLDWPWHPHAEMLPRAQAAVMANVTPALLIA